jgi:hypothetical protein
MNEERWFEQLAEETPLETAIPAPSCLKSLVYSHLISEAETEGPLLPLPETKAAGRGLCVFEHLIEILPVGAPLQNFQYCKICHARVLGERVEQAPIFWPCCPYSEFQNR